MEQSGGRSWFLRWELVGLVCFAGGDTSKQGKPRKTNETQGKQRKTRGTPSINKRNTFQSMGFLSKRGNTLPLSGNAKRLRVMVGIVLLVVDIVCWRGSDTEGTKGNEGRRWRGVGPAGRPSLFSFGGSVILKI